MLSIRLGENSALKLKSMAHDISASLQSGREVLCIIPDQFSFEFDNALYSNLGARDFNRVTVLSFKRLAKALTEQFGTQSGILVKPENRLALIYLALNKVKANKSLKIFSKQIDKPNFIAEVDTIIDSLTRSGISSDMLENASQSSKGTISDKLYDISLIYKAYREELSLRELRDESSMLLDAARAAAENSYFACKDIYLDRFDSFSPDELKLLEAAIKDAHSVNISLGLPNTYKPSLISPFALVSQTQNQLVSLASAYNRPLKYIKSSEDVSRTQSLTAVKDNLFTPVSVKQTNDGSVCLISADTVYEEADFVCAEISSLVNDHGYTYNDIAVFTHDVDTYSRVFESAFERYNITSFIDSRIPASSMSMALYALSAIDAACTRKPDTDRILTFIRSPFSFLNEQEISLIEDYCIKWNVNGEMWLEDFAEDKELSTGEYINSIRQKIILPLQKLNLSCKKATAKQVAAAFNDFLTEIHIAYRAKSVIEDSSEADKTENARLFKQLWNALMVSISSIYLTVGDTPITLKSFGELLRILLSSQTVSNPPQKLHSVKLCDVSRSIISTPKIVFVVGLNDGKFPSEIKKNGIFSAKDMQTLESLGVRFEASLTSRLDTERLDCYNAVCHATDKLYLSYSNADIKGKTINPSGLIKKVSAMLLTPIKTASSYPIEFYCRTPASAYYRFATAKKCSADELASVYESLLSVPEYKEKLLRLANRNDSHKLSPDISRRLFASGDIYVTPSKIDVYNSCNFKYFCRYGIQLDPVRPVAVDPANRGTVMHHVFQHVLMHFGESFSEATDEDISLLVSRLLEEYLLEAMSGNFGKTAKFKADYARLHGACMEILLNIREEYKVSKFRPVRFEYKLKSEDGKTVLSIPINNGLSVCLYGIVDRVDTYKASDGTEYIRIVDYKTGSKHLDYKDIYNGLNLQMLLYMLALTEGSDPDFKNCVPAGVLYVNSVFLKCDADYSPLSDSTAIRLKEANKQFKRTGLLIDDIISLDAMDNTFSGIYAPVEKKKDGTYKSDSKLISKESFEMLENFAERKAREFGNSLLIGKIDAVPIGEDKDKLPCRYCEFTSVCDRKKYMFKKTDAEADRLSLKKEIGEATESEMD